MADFFKNLNFPRSVILLSLIASCVLGWYVYQGQQRLAQLETERSGAPNVVRQIHQLGFAVEELSELRGSGDLIGVDDDIELRVRQAAKEKAVGIGELEIDKSSRNVGADLVDVIYTLRPRDNDARFSRHRLGNFLYKLDESNRLVVTKIELTPGGRRLNPGTIGDDQWDYIVEVTARQREGS